ncbi:DUF2442 domain-containing protein [Polynucleobacter difficilis]|uniref:DUF2442 domain-containing protein n=1 Tax=Polynucleobacter difficilis TaxID=556054 RepID=UPI000D33F475|nr:DUF2442 domain-containing protein [Polynucleobacter difficilis]
MDWDVSQVKVVGPLQLEVAFADGTRGRVVFEPTHLTGVFTSLQNPKFFNQVRINGGAVSWPGDIDLAPDSMHAAIRKSGDWVLR